VRRKKARIRGGGEGVLSKNGGREGIRRNAASKQIDLNIVNQEEEQLEGGK